MEEIIKNADHINQHGGNCKIQHKSQPECTNPVNPFTECGRKSTFQNRTNDKYRNQDPENDTKSPSHWQVQ